ncbi:MAG: bifunctional phosphoserine phosphatase/homoserine phosphotransferase ThrH [Spirochaetaceae bacterium]|nr:MAG: bifunctional phosphoserine phosphatase/homoserine phosphotransferase ThrH [Spirochaetaceae bacterium]
MRLVCLDLEGVLVPEIWISVAEVTGIPELRLTTRDIPDYDELMNHRLGILDREGIRLPDIQAVIETLDPLPGAAPFFEALRARTQAVILSDTFVQFAGPLMKKLRFPTLFCNELLVDSEGKITGYRLRQADGKRHAVTAFRSLNLQVIAVGDSYNDLSMIRAANAGALFHPPDTIVAEHPDLPVFRDYDALLSFLTSAPIHAEPHA